METYLIIDIKSPVTYCSLPFEIVADQIAIVSSHGAPAEFLLITSDIATYQVYKQTVKPIIGHLPTAENCYRLLSRKRFSEFSLNLEDYSGKAFTPSKEFALEIKFRNGPK